ncbi:YceK/YidQ family lipoprotein [Pseudomonas sp. PDM25]|uniref:YceK/YidQ family lipoprotein n=1 Tax=Pseudomonas sp. PDM25 TaxID=2854772 RepID=UPI0035C6B2D4
MSAVVLSGCGSFGAVLIHGPTCPYQGVHLDLYAATDWTTIKYTYGAIVPLAIIDVPFSFVFDTFSLGYATGGDLCPRDFK